MGVPSALETVIGLAMMGGVGGGVKVGVGRVKVLFPQAVSKRERMSIAEMGKKQREEAQVFMGLSVPKNSVPMELVSTLLDDVWDRIFTRA
jgi:hypothetical protein